MNDDDLLAGLVEAHARDDAADPLGDPLWEKLAAGTLTDEERRTLEARAANDESLKEALRVLAPFGSAFEERMTARIEAQVKAEAGARGGARRRMQRRVIAFTSALALAAAVLLVMRARAPEEERLPEYAMMVTG